MPIRQIQTLGKIILYYGLLYIGLLISAQKASDKPVPVKQDKTFRKRTLSNTTTMTEMESSETEEILKIRVEEVRPVVESFFKRLTLEQQRLVTQDAADDATSTLLAEMILDLISLVSKSILATLQNKCSQIISEERVQSGLGDTLLLSFAEVLQVKDPVHCDSSKNLNNMFDTEVAESIYSAITNSADTLEPVFSECVTPPHRLNMMVRHAFNMLKAFMGKMKEVLCSC